MFGYGLDPGRGLAVLLFSGVIRDEDHDACARAMVEFEARVTTAEQPAVILVDESRGDLARCGDGSGKPSQPVHQAKVAMLLAIVTGLERKGPSAVPGFFGDRYEQHVASSFENAVEWVEDHREAALSFFFEWLLADARRIAGSDTLADS
jgi:hypothetical protein